MPSRFSAWRYKYEIVITNPSGTAGIQSSFNLKFQPGMRADFRDIRFSDKYGSPLYFYIESYTAFSTAKVWVKLPVNDSKIYLYYGNGSVQNGSDGNNTFEFFDNFKTSSTIDTSKWTAYGAASIVSGQLKIGGSTNDAIDITSKTTFGEGYRTIIRANIPLARGQFESVGFIDIGDEHGYHGGVAWATYQLAPTTSFVYNTYEVRTSTADFSRAFHVFDISRKGSGTSQLIVDGASIIANQTGSTTASFPVGFRKYDSGTYLYVDYCFVVKYTPTPPVLALGRKFVQGNNGFIQFVDYGSEVKYILCSASGVLVDIIKDSKKINVYNGGSIGLLDNIEESLTLKVTMAAGDLQERGGLETYDLISCDVTKTISDTYLQLIAKLASSDTPAEDSTIKFYAVDSSNTQHLLFCGKVLTNSPTFGSYYSEGDMLATDDVRNLTVQKIPWNYRVMSLAGAYGTWSDWIRALTDFDKTGVKAGNISDTGRVDYQFSFDPKTTRLEAIKKICDYCNLLVNFKYISYDNNGVTQIAPALYAVPASEIDQPYSGFGLPDPCIFTDPADSSIIETPKITGQSDEKYNKVTVYGYLKSTGKLTVASVHTAAVEDGSQKAREYVIQDNTIQEKGSSAEIEAVKWLLYFSTNRATVSIKLTERFDFELYQRVKFGAGFDPALIALTDSNQLSFVAAYDPRDEANSKHMINVSGVPRPTWLRVSGIKYHSENLVETAELELITDFIYSSVDQVVQDPYAQYISPGYLKPVSDDSVSTVQSIVDNTVDKQAPEQCTVLSVDANSNTAIVQTQSGNVMTVRYL